MTLWIEEKEDGFWLRIEFEGGKRGAINLNKEHGPMVTEILRDAVKAGVHAPIATDKPRPGDSPTDAHRFKLPFKRQGYTQKASIGGQTIYVRTGEYQDGKLGEVFLDIAREGSAYRSLLNSFAIAVSIALQHGVPLEEFVDAFIDTRFEPQGDVKGHRFIRHASSVLDYIFRELVINYIEKGDPGHQPDGGVTEEQVQETARKESGLSDAKTIAGRTEGVALEEEARKIEEEDRKRVDQENVAAGSQKMPDVPKGYYDANPCPKCGAFKLRRTGTCYTCHGCFSTTGCD